MLFKRVFLFNEVVVKIAPRPLKPLKPDEKDWLVMALREEATELADSTNLVDQVDALIDSIIFATGGLYRLGLTEEQALQCFHAVMDANFEKKAGQKPTRVVGDVADAVKPAGWVGPEERIGGILNV